MLDQIALGLGAQKAPFPFAWYVAQGAGFSSISQTAAVATVAETTGTISLTAAWSAKKTDTDNDFTLTGETPDKLSLVDLADNGKTYVYAGSVGEGNKKLVATRAGIQYIKMTVALTGTVNSAQYGSYTATVSAGAANADILYLQDADDAIVWGGTAAEQTDDKFSKSLSFTLTINADAVSQSYSFWVAAAGLDSDQTSSNNSGTLSVSVA